MDISDAVLILQSIANPDQFKLSDKGKVNADVNGGGVTTADATVIQQVVAGVYKAENLPIN